ncbi:MAG: purine-nucleoside phosphorylase [Bacilli bacterium]|nr:purine-nucleoside phosphorylase [Bacilli bacterium]
MSTPHIEAEYLEIANTVIMPGDPLRAKFIADTYLEEVKMFNDVRNMFGYTGLYNGKKVSVMGSGMGIPSMGIYSYELYKFYNVEKIIRVGSCGSLSKDLNIFDIVLVDNSCSDSTYAYIQNGDTNKIISSSLTLNNKIEETSKKEGINIKKGNVYSTDVFDWYQNKENRETILKYNCIAAEMETFSLFHNAKLFNKEASCLLTVVDNLEKNASITAEERELNLNKMIELVLKSL